MTIPKGWHRIVRETGLIEWQCPHGVGHPAPRAGQPSHIQRAWSYGVWGVHGCDGCCKEYAS